MDDTLANSDGDIYSEMSLEQLRDEKRAIKSEWIVARSAYKNKLATIDSIIHTMCTCEVVHCSKKWIRGELVTRFKCRYCSNDYAAWVDGIGWVCASRKDKSFPTIVK